MDLNRETAMRLWVKYNGKKNETTDFAGRKILKGAYNDRNSEYGWNVDHILPQSRGGKTVDHNLICCHILTNDEKADKYPAFNANGKRFEIIKVENHYEVQPKSKEEAKKLNLVDKQLVHVQINGIKSGVMDAHIKVSDTAFFEMHIDTDDANAFIINDKNNKGTILI